MKRMLETKRTAAAIAALLGSILPAQAGLLNIATDPLGTATTSNKPNVMFILDDSGSMGRDSMPDYLDDTHNPTATNPTTAACADAGDDDSGSIGGTPDPCVFGDPPYNSSDLNGIYYNPSIFYRPAANSDGTDMDIQNSVNTADFTKVMVNPYTSTSTTDLSAGYQDRVFCISQGDAATSGNCRQNSAYQYPDPTFKYGRDGSGNVKYVTGAPYFYRMQSAQYCNLVVATGSAGTNCASGSSINVTTHTVLAPEFCSDPELTLCVAGGNVDPAIHIFSGVRWCADSGTLVDCRRKKGDLVDLTGKVVKRYLYAKHLGVTQSITCGPLVAYCQPAANEGNIKITSVNAAGGTISAVTVNGVSIINGPITVAAGATPADVVGLIVNSINTKVSSPEYGALNGGSNVIIQKTVLGATGSGWPVVMTSSQIGTASSIGRISISSTSAPSGSQTINTITVNGVNLLCGVGSDISFGNATVKATDGRIVINGTNSATKRTDLRNAIESRINACNINGFRASQSGSDVNIIAPVSQGSTPNGLTVSKTGSNIANITTGNMGSVQMGTQVSAINSTISNMSGGRDLLTGTQTIRKGVGAFTRTDLVPSNNSYPKADGRLDCLGATCTYEEEMTNFANWYAYYRTRMQMMKASVGRAFVSVGASYRVGFITICPVSGNNCGTSSAGVNVDPGKYLKINDFTGTHRDNWYAKLYATQPSNFTPLREALSRVGLIFAGKLGTQLTGGLTVAAGDDPVTASCQPNFAILSTDGYWNGGTGKLLDGTTNVGNQDNTNTGPYSLQSQGVYDGALASSTNTLADVALFYYKTDLRTTGAVATNNVPTTSKDTASHQHMVTFTVGLGLDGQLSYRPDYETAGSGDFFDIKQGTKKWPVPVADSPTALDDLWHAAVNGRGVFFSAKNPEELANGLSETLNQLQARVGAGAAAATSNLQPVAGDNFAFTAQYQTAAWIGDVKARTIDLSSGIVGQVQLWSAAGLLDGQLFSTRNIYTLDPTDSTGNGLKNFCWPGEGGTTCADGAGLNATEKTYFHPNLLPQWPTLSTLQKDEATQSSGPTWAGTNAGQNLVNWLRGSGLHNDTGQGLPQDVFRERLSRLGDVINAQPAYVKKSPFSYSDTGYAGFKKCTEGTGSGCVAAQFPTPSVSRRGTVYAAANDGMLHAFETDVNNSPYYQTAGIPTAATADDAFTGNNTGNGAERWTYIPRAVMPGLYRLADTSSPFTHAYHVDGSPTVGDICLSPCASQDDWRTILVAGLNSGGRGYYALDITNPLAPKALWEFTNSTFCVTTDDPGSTTDDVTIPDFTTPVGGDMKSDCHVGLSYGNPVIAKRNEDGKWVVLVTSGYNNNVNGGDGQGYLYMLDAATGVILRRFTTRVGSAASPSGLAKINGWATNAALDNTVLAVYGGDLEGNLWRFDLDRSSPSYLQVTKIAALVNGSGQIQPITVKPELGEVDVSGYKKRIIMLGTGKFLEASDKTGPFVTQTIYALRDDLSSGAGPVISDVRNTTLVKPRQFTAGTDPDTRTVNPSDPAPNWSTEYGWRIDLPDTGEHVNIDPQLQLGTLVIASNVPTSDTCTAGGYSYVNFLDYATGSYIPGAPGNMASTKIASSVAVGINVIMLPGGKVVAIVTTADNQQLTKDTPTPPAGFGGKRVSWRELIRDQ